MIYYANINQDVLSFLNPIELVFLDQQYRYYPVQFSDKIMHQYIGQISPPVFEWIRTS